MTKDDQEESLALAEYLEDQLYLERVHELFLMGAFDEEL